MDAPRKIIHVDMDAFYASVERLHRPETVGKPLIVGGSPDKRGVVASASYEARRFGVRSAMSTRQALKLCPTAIVVSPSMSRYKEVSRGIQSLFKEVTELVEPLSLDEAYLDVSQNNWGEVLGREVARRLRKEILSRFGLTASAGVGPNKFIAKLASDLRKPDALVVIPPERVLEFIAPLSVDKLWGVGPATAKRLRTIGLQKIEDVRATSASVLCQKLGKVGKFIHDLSWGIDNRVVNNQRELKSLGSETTFEKDVLEMGELRRCLEELAQDVAQSIARKQVKGKTITIKVRYANFETISRSCTLMQFIDQLSILRDTAFELLTRTEAGRIPIRLLGITLSNFEKIEAEDQLQLDI